jgi:hypothetical protein
VGLEKDAGGGVGDSGEPGYRGGARKPSLSSLVSPGATEVDLLNLSLIATRNHVFAWRMVTERRLKDRGGDRGAVQAIFSDHSGMSESNRCLRS